ncbi:MAG: hypothetical protein ICV60_04470 [Pyrinomonadaceae bacterium]|nr:hypothetical protein [Pyrinomonadaceae bacterium]
MAAPATPDSPKERTSSAQLFGRLSTFGAGKVAVNGSIVPSGTTVLSGSQLQTSETAGASVSLGTIGKVDLAPKTKLTLVFDQNSISVNVDSGDASLTTSEGITGSLVTSDGKTLTTDGKSTASVGTGMYAGDSRSPSPQASNRACRIAGIPCALFWAMVGGGTFVAIFFAATRGNNPSPSNQ